MRHPRRIAALLCVLLCAALASGCGVGPGETTEGAGVELLVTRDFGRQVILDRRFDELPASETVMRLLQRSADVETRYGGDFVQCVDGRCGGGAGGRRDWFYFVNGVEAPAGAAATKVRAGDRIWWDLRDWRAAQRAPAVVGSFPEPFLRGPHAERLAVRVECADVKAPACRRVRAELVAAGVVAGTTALRSQVTAGETLRVLVGPWDALREDEALRLLEEGPQASGVFAEPRADGTTIALLDARGRTVRTLGAGSGLVAAARLGQDPPVWAVSGVGAAGVEAAARAFDARTLRRRFAVAVDASGPLALPLVPAKDG